MSTDFNPGPGWREVDYDDIPIDVEWVQYRVGPGQNVRFWVREEPVPALPTEPHTVIRVTWKQPGEEPMSVLTGLGEGASWFGLDGAMFGNELVNMITGFEVLSEPRAVTAKAVLERVHDLTTSVTSHLSISAIGRDFGVGS